MAPGMALSFATFPYSLRLKQPLRTAHGTIVSRTGWLLRIRDGEGCTGWGEACPLEGFASRQACAAHAYDEAFLDLAARRAGVPVAELLGGPGVARRVEVNALESAAEGFRCLKLKVGGPVPEDLARVREIRRNLPDAVKIRVDANGGWSFEQALQAVPALEELGVEMLEQPLRAGDIEGLAELRRRTSLRIGVDESIQDLESALGLLAAGAADVFVLKPMRLGGLLPAAAIAAAAREAGIAVVVTSTLEGAIGRAGALHLAAAFGSPDWAQGLATGALLAEDVARGPEPEGGFLHVPGGPGLGVEP